MKDEQFRELCQCYFLGVISDDEMGVLDAALKSDANLRARFSAAARLDTNLRDAASSFKESEAEVVSLSSFASRAWWGGMAALIVVAFLISQLFREPVAGDPREPIAKIVELNGAVTWIADGEQTEGVLETGNELTGGTLEVSSLDSWVELVFDDGSEVWVSGPAVVTISDGEAGKLIRLREGDLSLDVRPQPEGRPMRVITPSAEAVVLGTQFNVSANSTSTSLIVNEGKVQVTRLADGSVEEVSADHRVVAALEHGSRFEASPRGEYVQVWKSEFPRDVRKGTLSYGVEGRPEFLRAETHLFRGDYGERIEPVLLHSVVLGPSVGRGQPVLLAEGARFLIRGRLDEGHEVNFGFGTHYERGGLSGKFSTRKKIAYGENGDFEIELTLADFQRMKSRFTESPAGHELVWLWVQTHRKDVGLGISSVELLSPETSSDE